MDQLKVSEQIAIRWFHADLERIVNERSNTPRELRESLPFWSDLTQGRRDEIRTRCELLLSGEIRRSEMTVPDKAIYFGPHRSEQGCPEVIWRAAEKKRIMAKRFEYWDCYRFDNPQRLSHLFGNANVGNLSETNIQVGEYFPGNQITAVQSWWLSVDLEPSEVRPWERLISDAFATFRVGDRPLACTPLHDLFRGPKPLQFVIPERQNYNVGIEFHCHQYMLNDFAQLVKRDPERRSFGFHIHFAGWQTLELM